jgi:hypothetical protein
MFSGPCVLSHPGGTAIIRLCDMARYGQHVKRRPRFLLVSYKYILLIFYKLGGIIQNYTSVIFIGPLRRSGRASAAA